MRCVKCTVLTHHYENREFYPWLVPQGNIFGVYGVIILLHLGLNQNLSLSLLIMLFLNGSQELLDTHNLYMYLCVDIRNIHVYIHI